MSNRQKTQLARWTSSMAFLFALGTVGGLERFHIAPGQGMAYVAAGLSVAVAAGLKGGIFR